MNPQNHSYTPFFQFVEFEENFEIDPQNHSCTPFFQFAEFEENFESDPQNHSCTPFFHHIGNEAFLRLIQLQYILPIITNE